MNTARYDLLRQRHPDAPESEIIALWTEQTYRDSVKPEVLAAALAAIRGGEGDTATGERVRAREAR